MLGNHVERVPENKGMTVDFQFHKLHALGRDIFVGIHVLPDVEIQDICARSVMNR